MRAVGSLTAAEQGRLLRASRDACPRDHAPTLTAPVGGRTSWWCSAEQLPGHPHG